jgi:hypothetical protein
MLQTIIDQEKVAEVVRFLLHDPTLPPHAGICEMDAAAYRLHPSVDEYCEALATIVHLVREMIRLDAIEAGFAKPKRSKSTDLFAGGAP